MFSLTALIGKCLYHVPIATVKQAELKQIATWDTVNTESRTPKGAITTTNRQSRFGFLRNFDKPKGDVIGW